MKIPLTETQAKVYRFVMQRFAETGVAPTMREISAFRKSKNVATGRGHIEVLIRKGYLKRKSEKAWSRGYYPVDFLCAGCEWFSGTCENVEVKDRIPGMKAVTPDFRCRFWKAQKIEGEE